jgi:hypothetical protein
VKPLISVHPDDPDEAVRERKAAYFAAKFDAIRMQTLALGYELVLTTENTLLMLRCPAGLLVVCVVDPALQNHDFCAGK